MQPAANPGIDLQQGGMAGALVSGFDAEKEAAGVARALWGDPSGSEESQRVIADALQRAYAAGIEAAAIVCDERAAMSKARAETVSATTIFRGLSEERGNAEAGCAAEIRALLPKPEKEAGR